MPDAADTKAGETTGQWNGTAGTTSSNSSTSKNDGSKGGGSSGTGSTGSGSSESKSQTSNSEAKSSAPSGTSKSTPSTASKGLTGPTSNSDAKGSAPTGTSVSKPATANTSTAYKGTAASNSVKVTDPSRMASASPAPQAPPASGTPDYDPLSSTPQNLNPFGSQPIGNLPTLNQVSTSLQNPVTSLQQAITGGLPPGSPMNPRGDRMSPLGDMPNIQGPMNYGPPGSLTTDYQISTPPTVNLGAYQQPQAPKIADRMVQTAGPLAAPGYQRTAPGPISGMSYTPGLPAQPQPPQFAQSSLPPTTDPRRTQMPGPTAYMGLPPGLEPRKTAGVVDPSLKPPDQVEYKTPAQPSTQVASGPMGTAFNPSLPPQPQGALAQAAGTLTGPYDPAAPNPAPYPGAMAYGGFSQSVFNPARDTLAGPSYVTGGYGSPGYDSDPATSVPGEREIAVEDVPPEAAPGPYAGKTMPYTDPNFKPPQIEIPYGGGPGKKAPSQADGQPQDLGELANRADYERDKARQGFKDLPGNLLSAILGGKFSAGTDLAGLQGIRGGGSQGSGLLPQPSTVPVEPTDVFSMITQLNQAGYSPEQQMKLIMSTFV